MQGHVFISYAREDKEEAHRLRGDLGAAGVPVWIDESDIHPGIDFDAEIDRGITNASAILVLLTPNSIFSMQVKSEYIFGLNRLVPVVPLLFRRCEMPRMLQPFQMINFIGRYDAGLASLRRCLATLPQRYFEHLQEIRKALLAAQEESSDPGRFQDKINAVTERIGGWNDRVERHESRVDSGLEKERRHMAEESRLRRSLSAERIVGHCLQDVSASFRNRVATIEDMSRQLEKRATKIISITGRAGIGKTALACKLLTDLELGKWPHTTEGPTVDGIIYMSMHTGEGVSLEQIFLKCARMIGDSDIEAVWKSTTMEVEEKVSFLLSKTVEGFYIILLDNIDNLLNESSQVAEPQLHCFLQLTLSLQNNLRVITTSRERIHFPDHSHFDLHHHFTVRLTDGLPPDEAIEFLREMDSLGELGLAQANDATLGEVVAMTHGVPRALQLFASLLANDPFLSIQQLKETFYDAEDVVKELVEENYLRLDNNARVVLLALAVFKRAVTVVAVDFLLQESVAGLDVPALLNRLKRAQTVTIDRITNLVALNEMDRDWIYSLHRKHASNGIFPSLSYLNHRAAEYYHQQRQDQQEWQGIEDVSQQLYEIEHLVEAASYTEALAVINEVDPYLEMWGYYYLAIRVRETLAGHLTGTERVDNLSRLGRLYALVGQMDKARECFNEALQIARGSSHQQYETNILGRLGSCAYDLGELEEAKTRYEEALSIARKIGDTLLESMHLYGLGRCFRGSYELGPAINCFKESLEKLDEKKKSGLETSREAIQFQYLIAHSLNNLGLCYRVLCDADQANQYYQQALEVMNQINDKGGKAHVMTNIASVERMVGNPAKALSLCQQALDIYFEINDRWGEGSALRNIGIIYSDLGEFQKASDYHQKSLVVNRSVKNKKGTAITLLNMGLTCLRDESKQDAIEYSRQSFDLFKSVGAIRYESHAAAQLSWSLLLDGNLAEAIVLAEKSYQCQVSETRYFALAILGTIALRQRRIVDAERAYRKALEGAEIQPLLTDRLPEMQYLCGYAQCGLAVISDTQLDDAIQAYNRAKEICKAPGVLAQQRVLLTAFGDDAQKLAPVRAMLSVAT